MKGNARELRSLRKTKLDEAKAAIDAAEAEGRDFTSDEQARYDALIQEADQLLKRAERLETFGGLEATLATRQAPAVNRHPLGDSEIRAVAAYVRTGDRGAVRELMAEPEAGEGSPVVEIKLPRRSEMRAVDSTMNITTAADGGSAVPTGFAGMIARRRNEIRLSDKLGVRLVPGKGTTVNFPYENADPVVLAATSEQSDAHGNNYERDTPVLGNKAFTLAKKTKKVELTEELLDDEDVNLLDFLADWMGRNIAKTHNALLLTEVAANGTALKTFAAAAAIAAGEPEDIVFNDALGYYLDDGGSVAWVMRNPTFGDIASITGNPRLYAQTPGGAFEHELLGYPVHLSSQAAAIGASAKSVYFGNWFEVGMREDPALRILRDPYSVDGLVILKYSFRAVYGVLQAAAIGYGVHPSA